MKQNKTKGDKTKGYELVKKDFREEVFADDVQGMRTWLRVI